mmetsp:Transcript_31723/g.66730  ORF Transcript_31723/g.66730 Transcript_31723/m.66730 type:complete len:254 (+) Transcript_31723:1127-1888(+)
MGAIVLVSASPIGADSNVFSTSSIASPSKIPGANCDKSGSSNSTSSSTDAAISISSLGEDTSISVPVEAISDESDPPYFFGTSDSRSSSCCSNFPSVATASLAVGGAALLDTSDSSISSWCSITFSTVGGAVSFGFQLLNRFINMRRESMVRLLSMPDCSAILFAAAPSSARRSTSLFPLSRQPSTSDGLTVFSSTKTSTKALPKPLNFAVPCDSPSTITVTPSSVQSNCKMLPFVACPPLSFTPSEIKEFRY